MDKKSTIGLEASMDIQIVTAGTPDRDIQYLEALLQLVKDSQAASPYMYPNNCDFYKSNLSGAAINILAFADYTLIGYAAFRILSPWPTYLKSDYQPIDSQPEHCALMLLNLVAPQFRGQGLGKRLAEARMKAAKAQSIKHLFATVHPDNRASMSILERQGFQLVAQQRLFTEQLLRNLMHKNIQTDSQSTFGESSAHSGCLQDVEAR